VQLRCAAFALALLCFVACQGEPSDTREWSPKDHDHTENPGGGQVDVSDGGNSQMAALGLNEVTLVAWKQNCVTCHGMIGRGDGPRGPGVRARDLGDPAWQASVTDEQIAASIKQGKGQMPPFDLPASTIAGLVKLTRLLNISRGRGDAGVDPDGAVADGAVADAKVKRKPAVRDGGVRD
jgi:cytochrome c oxidase cbb3-type subunit 3